MKKQATGDMILYKSFNNSLWVDFILRLLVDQRNSILKQRPARNIGLQYSYLVEKSFNLGCLNIDDVQMVYPEVVYDAYGKVKATPVHTVVLEAYPSKAELMLSSKFIPSGFRGLLSLFLPPNTARTLVKRRQQQLGIIGVIRKFPLVYILVMY